MTPKTKEHLLRSAKLAIAWALFMGITWLLLSYVYDNVPDNGKGRLTTFQSILNLLFITPTSSLSHRAGAYPFCSHLQKEATNEAMPSSTSGLAYTSRSGWPSGNVACFGPG